MAEVKMAIDDDWQESVSSQFLDIGSGELNESKDPLSQEDAAWVESCLIKESEFSIGSLESLKDALWEALTEQISPYSSLAGADIDIHGRNGHEYLTSEQSEGTSVRGYVRDNLFSTSLVLEDNKNVEDGVAVISTEDIESHEDIFRVWDLSMPLEGDEFVQELDKALIERPPCVPSPTLYDTGAADGCRPENLVAGMADGLDDLVAGMADLSLHPWSE